VAVLAVLVALAAVMAFQELEATKLA